MSYRMFHRIEQKAWTLFTLAMAAFALASIARAQEPEPGMCKTAILLWAPVNGAEVPILSADQVYGDRVACIVNKVRRESAAEILGFRASAAGVMPPSRCAGVRETLAAEGVAADDFIMTAAAINEAYGEDICPPDAPSPDASAGVPGGG